MSENATADEASRLDLGLGERTARVPFFSDAEIREAAIRPV